MGPKNETHQPVYEVAPEQPRPQIDDVVARREKRIETIRSRIAHERRIEHSAMYKAMEKEQDILRANIAKRHAETPADEDKQIMLKRRRALDDEDNKQTLINSRRFERILRVDHTRNDSLNAREEADKEEAAAAATTTFLFSIV
jgi:hypothetical protein